MTLAETDRLILRQFTLNDAQALRAVFGDREVMRYGPGHQSDAWIRYWLHQRMLSDRRREPFGQWAILLKEPKPASLIGVCGLSRYPDINGREEIEIGYRLAKAYWGQGLATEAAAALRDHAFDVIGIERLVALVDPANKASIRVAIKLGMKFEAIAMLAGYDHPDHVYTMQQPNPERSDT